MQLVSDARAEYGREETLVIEDGVRGLYTIKEGIIVMDPFKNYYIGSIVDDGTKVKFYTNDAAYKTKRKFMKLWTNGDRISPIIL
ncbi:hypothetical protein [Metabacillus niabensis]|uniref:hypothetical protein n=1 Tax=Metabacillus niabensis TaxID=324854 RepID=UPI0039A0A3C8